MSVAALVRDKIKQADTGTWIVVRDVVDQIGSRHAVELALTKAAGEGALVSVRRGLYWKGAKTRFGPTRPDALDAALAVARLHDFTSGVGPTGWSASHALGLSTQVPAETHVAIPGRVPAAPPGVRFHHRASRGRAGLGVLEVALLEVLSQFPDQVEASWEELVARVQSLIANGQIDRARVREAALKQHRIATRKSAERLDEDLDLADRASVVSDFA